MAITMIAILSLFISQIRLLESFQSLNFTSTILSGLSIRRGPSGALDQWMAALTRAGRAVCSSQRKKVHCMKTIKITFSQKAEEYYRDINDYKGDWPGLKFSSSLQCKQYET